jgi:hypothetical protein
MLCVIMRRTGRFRGIRQVACAFDAQAGIACKTFLVLRRARRKCEIGELMQDDIGGSRLDCAGERLCIKNIDDHRLGAESAQRAGLVCRTRGAENGMSCGSQQRRKPPSIAPAPARKIFIRPQYERMNSQPAAVGNCRVILPLASSDSSVIAAS